MARTNFLDTELDTRAGFTQAHVAEKLEVAPETMSRLERGQQWTDFETFSALAKLYGVEWAYWTKLGSKIVLLGSFWDNRCRLELPTEQSGIRSRKLLGYSALLTPWWVSMKRLADSSLERTIWTGQWSFTNVPVGEGSVGVEFWSEDDILVGCEVTRWGRVRCPW